MPNFDGGHYFLTTLIPISTDTLVERDGQKFSPVQSIRKSLALLPTALQTWVSERAGKNSPFSKSTRTHFARFVVIEDTMYNGRDPEDAIEGSIKAIFVKTNPVLPTPQDYLSGPYLLFVADFDAKSGDSSELTSYLEELWHETGNDLTPIFSHCHDFKNRVKTAEDFARYIQEGQIETTMPFNDYWTSAPPLKSWGTTLAAVGLGLLAVGGVVGFKVAAGLTTSFGGRVLGALAGGVISGGVGLAIDYGIVMKAGSKPFPTAPNTDLPSILKALYLQQKFTQFAIDMQGADDATLHKAFAAFLSTHQPGNTDKPTQPPGVIHSLKIRMARQLNLADIQGNILRGYGLPKARFIFLHVVKSSRGRQFVDTVRNRVTSALPWESDEKDYPKTPLTGKALPPKPKVTLNLAFTFWGLNALGVPTSTLRTMPGRIY